MKTTRPSTPEVTTLRQVKRAAILAAVEELDGNLSLAAEKLQISEVTLCRKLKEYGVVFKEQAVKRGNRPLQQ